MREAYAGVHVKSEECIFLGHYTVALAARKSAPATSPGILFIAAQLIDLLWPPFLLFGRSSPSHHTFRR